VLGRLGDGPRRRSLILQSLLLVVVGSVLAALPFGGLALLLTGRAVQGFGHALLPLLMAVA
jgi:MFS family permease